MEIYHYSKDTKEVIGKGTARKDPLEEDRYLIPAYATKKPPPTIEENEVAVFNEDLDSWEVKEDYRGEIYYNKAGEKIKITTIGETPKVDWTTEKTEKSEKSVSFLKDELLKKVRNTTGKLINERYKPFDRENLFVLQNKEDIKDYLTGKRATAIEVKENIQSMREACNILEQEIKEAASKEALEMIDIDEENLKEKAGWI